ncbi:DapH/DapD/GlmU-related protein [Rhizobium sp. BK377]|uniref:acyltransferase n=1 Tax=Rhizobium sp. BK377 TaxID=2587058 RepID=UPI00161E8E97|nr:acyltransferase [Rhizobium sp. BK377]MBB3463072.1 acetyltransferase-like isoleucine patch superfamily enzyme [Rhizobium sp. BK377]
MVNVDYLVRRLLGKATCVVASGAKISSHARIRNIRGDNKHIRIGRNSFIDGELLVFAHGGEIQIGEWCFLGEGSRIWSGLKINIGDRVLISHNVNVFDSLTHPLPAQERHKHFRTIFSEGHPKEIDLGERQVTIGDDAWIGANSSILRGVTIGRGAIVGVGSVVTKDVSPYSVVAGNPARVIRSQVDHDRPDLKAELP